MRFQYGGGSRRRGSLFAGIVIAAIALLSYLGSQEENPTTGQKQYIAMNQSQEIALGLQAAPSMAAQYGGLSPDAEQQAMVKRVGQAIVGKTAVAKSGYKFDFHVLADPNTLNAFALPGGQIFITAGLLNRMQTEGQLAGVLAHEITHVVGRHGAQQLAKQNLTSGLVMATGVATGDQGSAQMAAAVGHLLNLRYGRGDELESDALGVKWMSEAGYDPRAMLGVMRILGTAYHQGAPVEFFSTHPNPENRVANIEQAIAKQYPDGVPETLSD